MTLLKLIPVIALVGMSSAAAASDICSAAEERMRAAVSTYKKEGSAAFMREVLKNGPLEQDKRALGQDQALNQIEQFFGPIQAYSTLSKKPLGSRTCYLVGIIEYDNGPAFAVATFYRGTKGVGATAMFFRTEPEAVLPKQLLVE